MPCPWKLIIATVGCAASADAALLRPSPGRLLVALLARMARAILRLFPATFEMQAAGLIAAGALVEPFIPSLSAKASMLAPLALGISDSMGYERRGKQASGLFLAMFTGIRTVGPAVVSAAIIGYGLMATLPPEVAVRFDMLHWLVAMLPWFALVSILNYIAIVVLYAQRGSRAPAAARKASGQLGRRRSLPSAYRSMNARCSPSWCAASCYGRPSRCMAWGRTSLRWRRSWACWCAASCPPRSSGSRSRGIRDRKSVV